MAKQKVKKNVSPKFPIHWYYMATEEISVSEIKDAISSLPYDIEIWPEAGVLEVAMEEKASVDFEACDLDLRDDYSNDFLKEHGVKALFFMTLPNIDFSKCEALMKLIVSEKGGFFCADTDDFSPSVGL